jgi:hypothetical protein
MTVENELEDYPGSRAIIIAIAGSDEGARKVEESLKQFGGKVRIYVGTRFEERDRCFSESSRAIPSLEFRKRLRQFCEEAGERYRFPKKFWFGYEESESLVVFSRYRAE